MGFFLRQKPMEPTRALFDVSRRLNSTLDVDELCRILASSAVRLASGDGGCAGLRHNGSMICRAQVRNGRLLPRPEDALRPELGLPGRLPDCRSALVDNRVARMAAYRPLGARSAAAVPLCDAERRVIGFFEVYNKQAGFTEDDIELLTGLGEIASTAIQNALAFERVRRSEAGMREANEQLESFSYSVAHDLRSPLRGIASFADILLQRHGQRLDEEGRSHLERIRCASVKMGRLIDDILSLARVAREPLRVRRVDLSRLCEELVQELRQADPERRVETRVQPGAQTDADPALMRVALRQLLHNAWKFTSARREPVVEFLVKEHAFCVRDNGVGFRQEYARAIFRPFQHLGDQQGTGMGLALVDRIIRRHGGRCWAEADEGRGASFYFTLGT